MRTTFKYNKTKIMCKTQFPSDCSDFELLEIDTIYFDVLHNEEEWP